MNWLAELIGKKRVKKQGFPMTLLLLLLTAMGAVFLQFGPVFVEHMLKSGNLNQLIPEPGEREKLEVEKITLEIELLKKINDKLEDVKNPKLSAPESNILTSRKTDTDKRSHTTPQSSKVVIATEGTPKKLDIQVILVFEEQIFELCGYQEFTAKVAKTTDGKSAIKIRSMDRSIPNRSFRGYDKIVPINEMVELWPNCSAAFKYESLASTKRIVISYLRS